MALTAAQSAAKRLGVSKARISQLRSQGRLPSLEPEAVDAFAKKREAKEAYWEARKKRLRERDDKEDQFQCALLERLDTLNRNLATLIAAIVAGKVADTIAR